MKNFATRIKVRLTYLHFPNDSLHDIVLHSTFIWDLQLFLNLEYVEINKKILFSVKAMSSTELQFFVTLFIEKIRLYALLLRVYVLFKTILMNIIISHHFHS